MYKLKFIKYALVASMFALVGCNDVLNNVEPATSVSGDQVLSSAEGVSSLRAAMYSKLRFFDYSTQYFIGPSAFADETRNRPGSTRFQGLNNATGTDGDTNGLSAYNTTYAIILDANLLIGAIGEGVLDQATEDRYRGEAYAMRAMAMHYLVKALGYEPGQSPASGPGAGFDLGIVLVTEPTIDISDVGAQPRASVQDVYNQILSDLSEAKSLLSGINSPNTFITEAFVDGLTARVNLYAGNWAAANTAAGNAITNSGITLQDTQDGVANMFDETEGDHPEALFKFVVNPNTEPLGVNLNFNGSNINNGPAAYTAEQWSAQLPTNAVIDQYEASDYRLGWYETCYDTFNDQSENDCTSVNDEGWELQKFNGELGNLADNLPYMRIAEMYLIQAEARAKDNNSVAAGIGPLNTLRQARNASQVTLADFPGGMSDFEDFILDERVRELVSEGHRYWDLKRLQRNIPNPDGSIKMRYDSYRILDNIPASIRSANNALVDNPGY